MRKFKTGRTDNTVGNEQRVPNFLRGLQERGINNAKNNADKELPTGETWITGAEVYRWVISLGTLPNASAGPVIKYYSVPTSVGRMLSMTGMAYRNDGYVHLPIPYVDDMAGNYIQPTFYPNGGGLRIQYVGFDYSIYTEAHVVLRYIK